MNDTIANFILTGLAFGIGIVTNALFSSNMSTKAKSIVIGVCYTLWAIISSVFWWLKLEMWISIAISIIFLGMTLFVFLKSNLVNRKKISNILVNETRKADTADSSRPLRLIAGDLDFLGDLSTPPISDKKYKKLRRLSYIPWKRLSTFIELNQDIRYNEQWIQLKEMNFRKIHVICRKPSDEKSELMVGLLKSTFTNAVELKFYGDNNGFCDDCSNLAGCNSCNPCIKCPGLSLCKKAHKNGIAQCEELLTAKRLACCCLDLRIRGRLFRNREGALLVDIFRKISDSEEENRRKYINAIYTANQQEADFYDNLWHSLWKNCREETDFIEVCKNKYEGKFSNANIP